MTLDQISLKIIFGLFISSTVLASDPSLLTCEGKRTALSQMENSQVSKSFEQKFKTVTENTHLTSEENYKNLRQAVLKFRTGTGRESELARAKAYAAKMAQEMNLSHSTSLGSALGILKSGGILSTDELIRRGILQIDSKLRSHTMPSYEGEIGEQDVVYLAYTPKALPDERSFGEVTFIFDIGATLTHAYFTLDAFVAGAPLSFPNNPTNTPDCDLHIFNYNVASYRGVVFEGNRLIDLMNLSALQVLWNHDHPKFLELEKAAQPFVDNYFKALTPTFNPPFPRQAVTIACETLQMTGQKNTCFGFLISNDEILRPLTNLKNVFQPETEALGILKAFLTFPPYDDYSQALLQRGSPGFWEVKIPREAPLSLVNEIIIPGPVGKRSEYYTQNITAEKMEAAIDVFTTQMGWTYKKEVLQDGKWRFIFIKH